MRPEEERGYRQHLEYFSRDAHVVVDGERFAFSEADLEELAMQARNCLFVEGGLNSSVFSGAIYLAKKRFQPRLVRAQIIELVAATLRTTPDRVEHSLEFTANYMAFHDGTEVEDNHPYPRSER